MKFFTLLLLFSFSTYSQEDCDPIKTNSLHNHVHKLLDWWGATDKNVLNAPCKTKNAPGDEELTKFILGKAKGKTSGTVHGVQFKDESPVLIEAFKDFTTAKDSQGFYDNEALQKKIQEEYNVNPACDKVLCAMEKIWGKDFSKKLLFLKLKHNYNSSELAFENSDRFKPEELDDVIIGLEDLPGHLSPLGRKNQRLTHFKRGYTLKQYSGNVVANATIMIFDPWDNDSRASRQYTIFHEMSHNVSTKLSDMDDSPEWLKLSGWVKKGEDWATGTEACLVSDYGKTNPWEDFAESLSGYRYNGNEMKKKCPAKYEFVKNNVFKGIEYLTTKTCSPIPEESLQEIKNEMLADIINSTGQETFTDAELSAACKSGFSQYPVAATELATCSSKLHIERVLKNSSDKLAAVMKKNGIENNQANRDMVLNSITEQIQTDEALASDIAQRSSGIQSMIDQIARKSFDAANPPGFSLKTVKADDWKWRSSLKNCGMNFFEGKSDEAVACQLKDMIKGDRDSQKWGSGIFPTYQAPELFSKDAQDSLSEKREIILYAHLMKQPVTAEVKTLQEREFKNAMDYHQTNIENKMSSIPDWKKMSAEEFCSKTYAQGSTWTIAYGKEAGEIIPHILSRCVDEQNKKPRRFQFKESAWSQLIDSL